MVKNFLRMGTRDRLRLVIFVLLFVGAVLLWPILFCIKVDGELTASWVVLWIPLWIYDALGKLLNDWRGNAEGALGKTAFALTGVQSASQETKWRTRVQGSAGVLVCT